MLDGLRARLRTLVSRPSFERELDEELRYHIDREIERAVATGMSRADAAHSARRKFGNLGVIQEQARDAFGTRSVTDLAADVRFALRALVKSPGFTVVAALSLALGVGANAATFTVLDALYVRAPGGVRDPAGLRRIWIEHFSAGDGVPFKSQTMNYPMYRAIAVASGDSDRVALFATDYNLRLGKNATAPRVRAVYATANYFEVLGLHLAIGRFYQPDEDRLGHASPVVVLSHAFWVSRFGADSLALGRHLDVGKHSYRVIGVLDPAFTGLELQAADIWIPLASIPASATDGIPWWRLDWHMFRAVWRTPDGRSEPAFGQRASQAVREVNRTMYPTPDTLMNVLAGSLIEARGPGKQGQELIISTRLSGVAVIVLLIAGANVINLLLARAVRRRREIALRLALGISRWRLVRMLTVETLLLAGVAGMAALFAGWWGGHTLRSLLMPNIEWAHSALQWRVAWFTIAVAVLSGLVAGIVPAWQATAPDLTTALRAGARDGGVHRSRLRSGLVVVQATLSVMLLAGAALFVQSLRNVQGLDIGFDSSRLVFGSVQFPDGETPTPPVLSTAMREVVARLEGRPGIERVARAGMEPMYGSSFIMFYAGKDSTTSFRRVMPTMSTVSPSFFETVGMLLLRGRGLTPGDTDDAPPEVVVNEAMAALFWPGGNAIGACMYFETRKTPCYTVVGIAENVRRDHVIEEKPAPQYYVPLGNMPEHGWAGSTLIVRSRENGATAAVASLDSELRRAFPGAEASVTTMSRNLEPEYRPWRVGALLFTGFGLLALIVALVGIYSTVSYSVSQRSHEFGVRVALGARLGDVLRLVIGEGVKTVAVGVASGVVLTVAAGRLIAALLYGIAPGDPVVLGLVSASLLLVAALAALVPAWRAGRVDPVTALRSD
jgi:predicted permease